MHTHLIQCKRFDTVFTNDLQRIQASAVSVGHSYNLIDIPTRKIINVETASKNRISVHEIGAKPFFHANMYLHLQVPQVIKPVKASINIQV